MMKGRGRPKSNVRAGSRGRRTGALALEVLVEEL